MDYESYYKNQIENPVFKGAIYQRGHGFGDVFKKFFRWIVPIVKQHAGPIASTVGKEALKSAINIANDSLEGKNFTTSSKERFKESLNNLSSKIGSGRKRKKKTKNIALPTQLKKVYKKVKKTKINIIKKRKLDIFD